MKMMKLFWVSQYSIIDGVISATVVGSRPQRSQPQWGQPQRRRSRFCQRHWRTTGKSQVTQRRNHA